MIDTHAHLDFKEFDKDREEVLARFFADNGRAIVNIGADLAGSERSVQLASEHEKVFAVVGIHPHEADKEVDLEKINILASEDKVVAIGEIGLDYFWVKDDSVKEKQKELFTAQIEIAKKHNLPIVIHCRDAYEELYSLLPSFSGLKTVIHCYGGNLAQTKKFLEFSNVYFSFTGNVTFVKAKEDKPEPEIFKVIKEIPIERVMVETDCPYLAPVPYRGQRNEPVYTREVIKKIAQIKELTEKEIEEITDKNAIDFFGLNI